MISEITPNEHFFITYRTYRNNFYIFGSENLLLQTEEISSSVIYLIKESL